MRRSAILVPVSLVLPALFAACGGGSEATTAAGTASGSASSSTGSGEATSSSGGMTGGAGGAMSGSGGMSSGTGGAMTGTGGGMTGTCATGDMRSCYDGPAATENVGACKSGTQACMAGEWGPCTGAVLPATEACDGVDNDCNGATDEGCDPPWSRGLVSNGDDGVRDIAVDLAGNVYVTGYFSSPLDFGGGTLTAASLLPDGFVAKYSASGAHVWSMRFGGIYADHGYGIAVDGSGNVYVTGDYASPADFGGTMVTSPHYSDAFVAKLSPAGSVLWVKSFGTKYGGAGTGIAADAAGNVVATGRITYDAASPVVDLGGGSKPLYGNVDIFAVKLAPDGSHLWSATYGGNGLDYGFRAALDSAGNVILNGEVSQTADIGNGSTGGGSLEAFVTKLSPTGAHLWSKRFAGTGSTNGQLSAAAFDALGNVIMCGPMTGPVDLGGGPVPNGSNQDIFVAKYTPAGAYVWAVNKGDASGGGCHGVAADAAGNVLVGGYLGTSGLQSPWLWRVTAAGTVVSSTSFPVTANSSIWTALPAPGGRVAIGGFFSGSLDLGPSGTLTGTLGNDGFVAVVP
ncbi:MAG: SBBP repeat-containing protein [Minicystis sp.]